jgi:hypothetical protein
VTKTTLYVSHGSTASLLAGGVQAGNTTTGEWVTDGTIFFLQNNSNGNDKSSANTLGCGTVGITHTAASRGSLTASPATIVTTASVSKTTLSWSCTSCSKTQVRIGSPGGSLFAMGKSTGSETTGNWVTDGMTFYLQDAGGSTPTSANNTVATATVHFQAPSNGNSGGNGVSGVITGTPNPAQYPHGGAPYASILLSWTCGACSRTEVHVDSPGGPLMGKANSSGAATTGNWVTNGTVFYLQDATNGNATSAANTVATFTATVTEAAPAPPSFSNGGTITATPNPIPISVIDFGQTTLSWSCSNSCTKTEVHIGSADGTVFAVGLASGSSTTGLWVTNGTRFYLQDATKGNATAASNTLAWVEVDTTQQ